MFHRSSSNQPWLLGATILSATVCAVVVVLPAVQTQPGSAQVSPSPSSLTTVAPKTTSPWSLTTIAPEITSPPLDLDPYSEKVCPLLSPGQLAPMVTIEPGREHRTTSGNVCLWLVAGGSITGTLWLSVLPQTPGAWDSMYEEREIFPSFEPAGQVNGYPAVHVALRPGDLRHGDCATVVGASPDQVFQVVMSIDSRSPSFSSPCTETDFVASRVIDTLKDDL